MQREAQVVHAVVTVGEAEVDVAPAEFHGLHRLGLLAAAAAVGVDDGTVIERLAAGLQHTTLQPHLIGV